MGNNVDCTNAKKVFRSDFYKLDGPDAGVSESGPSPQVYSVL